VRLVAAAALVAAACGGAPKPVAPAAPATIVVLDPGAEPRQVLRYQFAAGTSERVELTHKLRTTMRFTDTTLQDSAESVDFPSITFVIRAEVTEIAPDGTAVVGATLEAITVLDDVVDPMVRAQVAAASQQTKGARGTWRRAPSGRVSGVRFEAPAASPAARARLAKVAEAIERATAGLPGVPIGAGARWRVTDAFSFAGVRWTRTSTYRLKELAGMTARVEADATIVAPPQTLSVEPNATTRLTSARGTVRGEYAVSLRGIGGTGTTSATGEASLSIVRGRARVTATLQTEELSSTRIVP
jgi:hypothetical protein